MSAVLLLTPKEVEYFRNGGILHYVLRQLASKKTAYRTAPGKAVGRTRAFGQRKTARSHGFLRAAAR